MSQALHNAYLDRLNVRQQTYHYYNQSQAEKSLGSLKKLPKSLAVLLENLLRHLDGETVQQADLDAVSAWLEHGHSDREIAYRPARVLMQDFTGVPAVVDLAAMRNAVHRLEAEVNRVNPLSPVDLVIDHSVTVDHFGNRQALVENTRLEMTLNHERYQFLRWGKRRFVISVWCLRALEFAIRLIWSIWLTPCGVKP